MVMVLKRLKRYFDFLVFLAKKKMFEKKDVRNIFFLHQILPWKIVFRKNWQILRASSSVVLRMEKRRIFVVWNETQISVPTG